MGRADYVKRGSSNAICDICGFKFKREDLLLTWDGYRACRKDFYIRNPQEFVRGVLDRQTPPWTRVDQPPIYVALLDVETALVNGFQFNNGGFN